MNLHFDPFCIFAAKFQVAELVALRLLPLMQAAGFAGLVKHEVAKMGCYECNEVEGPW